MQAVVMHAVELHAYRCHAVGLHARSGAAVGLHARNGYAFGLHARSCQAVGLDASGGPAVWLHARNGQIKLIIFKLNSNQLDLIYETDSVDTQVQILTDNFLLALDSCAPFEVKLIQRSLLDQLFPTGGSRPLMGPRSHFMWVADMLPVFENINSKKTEQNAFVPE